MTLSLRGSKGLLATSVRGSLLVQTATYVPLIVWYWLASGTSLYTRMNIVSPSEMPLPANVVLYYISSDGGAVMSRSGTDQQDRKMHDLASRDENDRLFAQRSQDRKSWDLAARLEGSDPRWPQIAVIEPAFAASAALDWRAERDSRYMVDGSRANCGRAARLGSAVSSPWELWAGNWPIEGLNAINESVGASVRFSLETPFAAWAVRNVTHLPNDQAIFQLGDDQICIFDPQTKRIALLAHGRGPVAALREVETTRPATDEMGSTAK